ncbi:MAG TPA: DUF3379 family protein [Steroidobacteraceae bacterium]|jgi:hypothetical protein|nr:DUF3379 family protein [Steroidobacteraceae bacterium]
MIDCRQYRRSILADPHGQDPEFGQHLEGCTECAAYTERLLRFEGKLARAMRVTPPAAAAAAESRGRVIPFRRRHVRLRGGWLAMAASVLLGLVIAGGLWLGAPHASLAADVVAHMAGEPQAWTRTDVPVPSPALAAVLRNTHLRLKPGAGMVSYAQSCLFRGHRVPHLVVQTEMGPVTVMVLVHENVSKAEPFDEQGYRGVIVPMPGHGSLAVLAKDQSGDLTSVKKIAARVQDAIEWTS